MTDNGFACAVLRNVEPLHFTPESSERIDTVRCDRRGGVLVDYNWRVDLILGPDDRVRTVDAFCSMASFWLP